MIGLHPATLLGVLAAVAVLVWMHPGPRPRRFPEDPEPEDGSSEGGPSPGRPARRSLGRGSAPSPQPEPGDLAECCDLLAVAASAGMTVAESVRAVGAVGTGPVAALLRATGAAVDDGERLVEVLGRDLGRVAMPVRPLVSALLNTAISGAPVGPSLLRLADAERRRSRRRVEARVRRLPVLLLIPLVGLVLPAFVVLTLVPVGLVAARDAGLADRLSASPDSHPSELLRGRQ